MAKAQESASSSTCSWKLRKTQVVIKEFDYIRFTMTDINGVLRGCLLPADLAAKCLKTGVHWHEGMISLQHDEQPTHPKEGGSRRMNAHAVPDINTLHAIPWVKGYKLGQLMTEMYWNPKTPQDACPRIIARRILSKIDDMGLKLYSGRELGFILTDSSTQLPVFSGTNYMSMLRFAEYEPWMVSIASNMKTTGFEVGTMHTDICAGQFGLTTQPRFGIDAADGAVVLKQCIKEMAMQRGWNATFMSVSGDIESGYRPACAAHFNFSVWHKVWDVNAFWDESAEDMISDFGKHWIAGIIHHAKALTAVSRPTTNCYHTRHDKTIPNHANWGVEDRYAMLCVKNHGPNCTYVENRLPSALSNPYIVLAATIAAGMDGVFRKLPCPDSCDVSEAVRLPVSLSEALGCLQEDAAMVEALGEQFVDRFVNLKRGDVKVVEGVVDEYEIAELERKQYAYMM